MFNKQSAIFLFSVIMATAASGIFFATLNNFLFEIYNINAEGRGVVEFFRELPGVLAVFFLAVSVIMREKNLMVVCALLTALSYLGMATQPANYTLAVLAIFIWSIGQHINLVLQQSYGIALSIAEKRGKLFGVVGGARGIGYIIGTSIVWLGMGRFGLGYKEVYIAAAIFMVLASVGYSLLKPKGHTATRRRRWVLKRKYSLYYTMAVLFGVRKQIFLVFAPWLLVKIYNLAASEIGLLLLLAAAVGIFSKPLLGLAIDRFGERNILIADALILFLVCLGYMFIPHFISIALALPFLYILYIIDDNLFSLRSAHTTYLSKITYSKDELTSTISMGFAIEHVLSMGGPVVAGIVWVKYGFSYVFAICAFCALLMLITVINIPTKAKLTQISNSHNMPPCS
ncbi:MAG: MFS transporter [Pseudomonadota bacterium]